MILTVKLFVLLLSVMASVFSLSIPRVRFTPKSRPLAVRDSNLVPKPDILNSEAASLGSAILPRSEESLPDAYSDDRPRIVPKPGTHSAKKSSTDNSSTETSSPEEPSTEKSSTEKSLAKTKKPSSKKKHPTKKKHSGKKKPKSGKKKHSGKNKHSSGKNSESGTGRTGRGQITLYNAAEDTGSCGKFHHDHEMVGAASHSMYDSEHGANTRDPNNNPLCGKRVRLTVVDTGVTFVIKIVDRCGACKYHDWDLSRGAWDASGVAVVDGRANTTYEFLS